MIAGYTAGQKVKVINLIDGWGRPDPRVRPYIDKTGVVVKSYCVSPDEVWEKMLILNDVFCYDIRLDGDGIIVCGLPEIALEPHLFGV
jgi:hypothetical protein